MRHNTLLLLLCYTIWASAQFRFAQVTDIHLNLRAPNTTEDLQRTIAQLNATDSLDFVLVTGDLSDDGDLPTLQEAKRHLASLRHPYYVVMGNHETKWSASGCTAWQETYGYERFEFTHKDVHFLGFNTGPLMRMAYGHVTKQDLTWLRERLDTYPKDEPVIIVTHYPLLKGDVDNWYQVTDLLRQYNVRLCIGGHYHATANYSYDGIPGILCRSNLRNAQTGRPGYMLYEVTTDSIFADLQDVGGPKVRFAAYSTQGIIKDTNGRELVPSAGAWEYPDMSDNAIYNKVERVWLQQGASVYSSPAVQGNRLFVGDDTGVLTAYRLKDGHPLWQFQTQARIVGTPAASQGVVVVGSADKFIYGLKASNGSLLWKVRCDESVIGAVTIHKGIAYVGASDHRMRAIDIRNGKVRWTYDGVEGYIETKPLVTDEHVVFGAWDKTLYSLHTADGTLQWKWQINRNSMHYSPAAVWPVEADGKVFIADPERALTAIDAHTGETVWHTFQSVVRETVGLSEDKQRIYSKTMQDSLVCYSTQGTEPHEVWASCVGFGYEHGPCMPQEKDGVVYGSTKEGMIFAVEATEGKLLWRHHIGNALINTVVPLSGRRVLFTSSDGDVGMLHWKE